MKKPAHENAIPLIILLNAIGLTFAALGFILIILSMR
jgi:hypothetical protein